MRRWRKSTWVFLGFAALGAVLLLPSLFGEDPDWNQVGEDAGEWIRNLFG